MSDALFDVPADAYVVPPAPEQLTRAERRPTDTPAVGIWGELIDGYAPPWITPEAVVAAVDAVADSGLDLSPKVFLDMVQEG